MAAFNKQMPIQNNSSIDSVGSSAPALCRSIFFRKYYQGHSLGTVFIRRQINNAGRKGYAVPWGFQEMLSLTDRQKNKYIHMNTDFSTQCQVTQ